MHDGGSVVTRFSLGGKCSSQATGNTDHKLRQRHLTINRTRVYMAVLFKEVGRRESETSAARLLIVTVKRDSIRMQAILFCEYDSGAQTRLCWRVATAQ